jgi:hypothetical protein
MTIMSILAVLHLLKTQNIVVSFLTLLQIMCLLLIVVINVSNKCHVLLCIKPYTFFVSIY